MIRLRFLYRIGFQSILVGLVTLLTPLPSDCASLVPVYRTQEQTGLPEIRLQIGKHGYTLEHATTPEQSARGLMFRQFLPPNHGMLFSFPKLGPVAFWMKDTLIPLDMIFLRNEKIVYIQNAAPPCVMQAEPCPSYSPGPDTPVNAVIELPGGTAQAHGLQPGLVVHGLLLSNPMAPSLVSKARSH